MCIKRSDIIKASRKVAMDQHSDKNPGNKVTEEKLKAATEACYVLSNPEKKHQYDPFDTL